MLLALLATLHASATTPDVAQGWYLWDVRRYEEAAAVAAAVLREDPDDLAALRLYASTMHRAFPGDEITEIQYRDRVDADTEDPVGRIALAHLIVDGATRAGTWCGEVERLLEVLPDDPTQRYWALRARHDAHRLCPGAREDDRTALIALSGEVEEAFGYGVVLQVYYGEVTEALVPDIVTALEREPWRMGSMKKLWDDGCEGRGLARARKEVLAMAEAALGSGDALRLHEARRVLGAAGKDRLAEQASRELAQVDPKPPVRDPSPPTPPIARELGRARRSGAAEEALAAVDKVPHDPHGVERSLWEATRGRLLYDLDRLEEARLAFQAAVREDPEAREAALYYGLTAAMTGVDTAPAQIAVDAALEQARREVWRPDPTQGIGWERWQERRAEERASLLEIRSRLRPADQADEALADLQEAILLAPSGDRLVRLGLARWEDEPTAAALHLIEGLARVPSDGELAAAARERLTAVWEQGPFWHRDGLDGLVAARAAELAASGDAPPEEDVHPLVGQPFPAVTVTEGGAQVDLADVPGPVVVDVFATWCGPCKQALPHVDEVARTWEGKVQVFVISVDEREAAFDRFLRHEERAWRAGWAGRDLMSLLGVRAIPAQFLLNADHEVVAMFPGYRTRDHRLDDALAELLGPPPAPAEDDR